MHTWDKIDDREIYKHLSERREEESLLYNHENVESTFGENPKSTHRLANSNQRSLMLIINNAIHKRLNLLFSLVLTTLALFYDDIMKRDNIMANNININTKNYEGNIIIKKTKSSNIKTI